MGVASRGAGVAVAGVGAVNVSPSAVMTASRVPTSTVTPSSTRIALMTPLACAGISVSTLSVETSNNGSPRVTDSPTCLNHFATVPSATVSPNWGMVTL